MQPVVTCNYDMGRFEARLPGKTVWVDGGSNTSPFYAFAESRESIEVLRKFANEAMERSLRLAPSQPIVLANYAFSGRTSGMIGSNLGM